MPPAPADDHVLAARLATEAGELLVGLRARLSADGVDGRPLGAEGDRAAHELLMNRLGSARPGDAVLSEEGVADPARLDAERVWIVDPLDGTREFGELHRTDWAVHVTLVVAGSPVAGAVALPARGLTLATSPPPPAPAPWTGSPRVVVSRSRPPVSAARVASALGGSLVPLGSAGAKAMAVVLGEAEVYPHSGGQHEWDSAAPVAVARAAGLHASRLDGSPLVYNRPDPYMPDLLICRPELADRVIAAAREG
jgi:3'(2'), 5'-bisphosphate nucleotidase